MAIGLYQRVFRMTAVYATPALHPHETLSPFKIKKLVFSHQAFASSAFHGVASSHEIRYRS
jgi:hypothetical protein